MSENFNFKPLLEDENPFIKFSKFFKANSSEVPDLFRHIINCILNETLNELSILRSINSQNDLGASANELVKYHSLADRYMGQEDHAEFRIGCTDNFFDKVARDISTICVVLQETCREMLDMGSHDVMLEAVQAVKQMHVDGEELLEDETRLEKRLQELQQQLEDERLQSLKTIEDTNEKIQKLHFEVEDIYIYGKTEVEFFEKWETTRVEQNVIRNNDKENNFRNIVKDTNDRAERENRCHGEMERYFVNMKNDFMDQIQVWMKKYDDEIDQYDSDIIQLRDDLEKITEERKVTAEKYEMRQKEIDEWVAYKTAKAVRDKQEKLEKDSARLIQMWWRQMIRVWKLGPYKKKKGKEKKKKKK